MRVASFWPKGSPSQPHSHDTTTDPLGDKEDTWRGAAIDYRIGEEYAAEAYPFALIPLAADR